MSDDKIVAVCGACGARMRAAASARGRKARCPKCGATFIIGDAANETPTAPDGGAMNDDALAALAGGDSVESQEAIQARADARMAQARNAQAVKAEAPPPRPGRSSSNFGLWVLNFGRALAPTNVPARVQLVMVFFGVVCIIYGFKSAALYDRWSGTPTKVRHADLIDGKSDGNAHVLLTDFYFLPQYVYVMRGSHWGGAWVPIAPTQDVEAALAGTPLAKGFDPATMGAKRREDVLAMMNKRGVRIDIVYMPDATTEADVDRVWETRPLECTLTSDFGIGGLKTENRRILRKDYPDADLDHCRVMRLGGLPTSLGTTRLYQFGGAGLVIFAIGMAAVRAARQST